tara:strand:- start:1151 stop:1633 length:483 start_codon:yes stop_codon:yes gene_type:complete
MPNKTRMKKTFSFKKLANKIDDIVVKDINTLGNHINKTIQKGIDKGKDIKGNSFKKLEPITVALGGKKILDRTGEMRKTQTYKATSSNPKYIIEMQTKYGVYHNTGFTQTDKKQWFYGAKVPKREWFGIPKSMTPGESGYKKAVLERHLRIKMAWKKLGT